MNWRERGRLVFSVLCAEGRGSAKGGRRWPAREGREGEEGPREGREARRQSPRREEARRKEVSAELWFFSLSPIDDAAHSTCILALNLLHRPSNKYVLYTVTFDAQSLAEL